MRIESSAIPIGRTTIASTLSSGDGENGRIAASPQRGKEDKELRKTCRDFEAIFTSFLLKSMRKTVQKNDLFGSAKEEEYFQDMLDTQISETAAKESSNGLASVLYRQLSAKSIGSAGNPAKGRTEESTTGGDRQ